MSPEVTLYQLRPDKTVIDKNLFIIP